MLLGLGSMLTAVQASPSLAAKETAQVGDYLPAMPGIDGFVEFIPDRKKVDHPTRSQRLSRLPSNCVNSHDCSQFMLSAVVCDADTSYPRGHGKPAHLSPWDPFGAHLCAHEITRRVLHGFKVYPIACRWIQPILTGLRCHRPSESNRLQTSSPGTTVSHGERSHTVRCLPYSLMQAGIVSSACGNAVDVHVHIEGHSNENKLDLPHLTWYGAPGTRSEWLLLSTPCMTSRHVQMRGAVD